MSPHPSPTHAYTNLVPSLTMPTIMHGTTAPSVSPLVGTPQGHSASPYRGPPSSQISLSCAQIIKCVSNILQQPNTEEGKWLWKTDVEMWHRTYGGNATPSLERLYPLKQGTAILGSGECFVCGMVTNSPHIGGTCQATEPLQPLESKWRQLMAGML